MAKISSVVKLTAQPGKRQELLDAMRTMLPAVADEPGTEVYAFNTDNADENVLWIFEVYTDQAALDAHGSSPAMANLLGLLGPLLGDAPLMAFGDLTDAKGIEA